MRLADEFLKSGKAANWAEAHQMATDVIPQGKPASATKFLQAAGYELRKQSLATLGFASYQEYLASDLWKRIRYRALRRDGWLCKVCRKPARCVHHRHYSLDAMAGLDISSLVSLCHNCHEAAEFHDGRKTGLRRANEHIATAVRINKWNTVSATGDTDRNDQMPEKPNCQAVCGVKHGANEKFSGGQVPAEVGVPLSVDHDIATPQKHGDDSNRPPRITAGQTEHGRALNRPEPSQIPWD